MCGIAGIVDFKNPPDEKALSAMERALTHRGPDDGRVWHDRACGLVHRRLRIIDLSAAAAQPMTNESDGLWVVFNGEIYNFQHLRKELLSLGHQFRSQSDTEVLLHGYESWGTNLFRRLRGMFALALWDRTTRELVVARDRLGKKPLFYSFANDRFIFASELTVFRCVPGLELSLCRPAFRQYLEYGYVQSPKTILNEVQRLPAGHFAIWNESGLRVESYWALPTRFDSSRIIGTPEQAADALEEPLRDAVACRLVSDVPLGCFLSGGVDSSLVAALAQEGLRERLKTYTVGFESSGLSEASHAAKVAGHLGTEHHELMVDPDSVFTEFEAILSKTSEPVGDDSFVPTHLISRETRRHVTVALSGDGGDELFAGYEKYRQFESAKRIQALPLPWRQLARLPANDGVKKSLEALATRRPMELARWLSSLWKRDEINLLLAPPLRATHSADAFDRAWQRRLQLPDLERWMLTDMETYLEGDILTKVDRASMAVALETRSPFLDHLFVEAASRWACRAEINTGGKKILKQMLAKRLPRELFARPKQGFGMPIEQWYRGPLREILLRYTDPRRIRRRGLLDSDKVTDVVNQHLSGKRNFARKLHAVAAFEIWADQFFGSGCALA